MNELKQKKENILNLINELELKQREFASLVSNNQDNGFTQQEWYEYADRNEKINKLLEELKNLHKAY